MVNNIGVLGILGFLLNPETPGNSGFATQDCHVGYFGGMRTAPTCRESASCVLHTKKESHKKGYNPNLQTQIINVKPAI